MSCHPHRRDRFKKVRPSNLRSLPRIVYEWVDYIEGFDEDDYFLDRLLFFPRRRMARTKFQGGRRAEPGIDDDSDEFGEDSDVFGY